MRKSEQKVPLYINNNSKMHILTATIGGQELRNNGQELRNNGHHLHNGVMDLHY